MHPPPGCETASSAHPTHTQDARQPVDGDDFGGEKIGSGAPQTLRGGDVDVFFRAAIRHDALLREVTKLRHEAARFSHECEAGGLSKHVKTSLHGTCTLTVFWPVGNMSNDLQTIWAQCADRLQRSWSDKIGCDASPTIGWSPSGSRHSILIPGSAGSAAVLRVRSPIIADGDINLQQSRLGVQQRFLGMDARWPLTNSASPDQGFARRGKHDEAHTSTWETTGTNNAWQKIAELKSDQHTAQCEHAELHAECRALRAQNAALVADVRAWDEACRFMTAEGDALKAENRMLQSTRDDLQVEVINTKVILAKVTAERDLLNAKVNAAQTRLAKEAAFTEKRVSVVEDTLQQELDTLRQTHADLQQQHTSMESENAHDRPSRGERVEDLEKNHSRMHGQRAMLEAEIVSADAAGTAHQYAKLVERCETLQRELKAQEMTMKLMQTAHSEAEFQACAMDSAQAQILETLDELHLQLQMAHSEMILSPSARIQPPQDKLQIEQLMLSPAEKSMKPNQAQFAAVKNQRVIKNLQNVMSVKEPKETNHHDGNGELSVKENPSALLHRSDALGHFSSLVWWLPAPDTETVGNRDGKAEFKTAQAKTDLNDSCHSGMCASQSSEVIVEFTDQFLGLNIREANDLCVEVAAISQKCALASVLYGSEMRPGIGDRVSSVNGVSCRGLDFKTVSALIGEFGSLIRVFESL